MNFAIHITVHCYAEDNLTDECLEIGSDFYGIIGKEIIVPLRDVNGKTFHINDVVDDFSVQDLWDWLCDKIYSDALSADSSQKDLLSFDSDCCVVQKYICFDGWRYTVEKPSKPLIYFMRRKAVSENSPVEVQLLLCADAGEVLRDDGIRYYFNSKEDGEHHWPHVHVDVRHEESGSFSLITGLQLQKEKKINTKDTKKIRKMIFKHQLDWLRYWNEHTDGLSVDLNQVQGLIRY